MKLIPPDLKRCQALKPNKRGPFSFGSGHKMIRCTNKPIFIVTEKEPAEDGLKGSMSLCAHCLAVFSKQMPDKYVELTNIKKEESPKKEK